MPLPIYLAHRLTEELAKAGGMKATVKTQNREGWRTLRLPVTIRVFGTGVHRASLETASQGVYREENIGDISQERLTNYFIKTDDGYVVNQKLRQSVVFAPHNLIKEPS